MIGGVAVHRVGMTTGPLTVSAAAGLTGASARPAIARTAASTTVSTLLGRGMGDGARGPAPTARSGRIMGCVSSWRREPGVGRGLAGPAPRSRSETTGARSRPLAEGQREGGLVLAGGRAGRDDQVETGAAAEAAARGGLGGRAEGLRRAAEAVAHDVAGGDVAGADLGARCDGGHVTGDLLVQDRGHGAPAEVVARDALVAPGARVGGRAVVAEAVDLEVGHLTGERPGLAVAPPVDDGDGVHRPRGHLGCAVQRDRLEGDVGLLLGHAQHVAEDLELDELVEPAVGHRGLVRLAADALVALDLHGEGARVRADGVGTLVLDGVGAGAG